jgi:hypothetical protein
MKLLRSGQSVTTIFDLLGSKENDMSAALAYALSRSPRFLEAVVQDLCGSAPHNLQHAVIQVQTSRRAQGITDVEIQIGSDVFVILEAKRGAELPSRTQLALYAPTLRNAQAACARLVAVTNATPDYARIVLDPPSIQGIPLVHRSWRELQRLASAARAAETNINKLLLDQFASYLGGLLGMEKIYSNMVYVVALATGNPAGWSLSWIDVVRQRNRYFYPVEGSGWPDPPNYIGFRYGGKLQSIHHVDGYEIFDNPRVIFPEAADERWSPHFCLELGRAIFPTHEVRTGPRIHRGARRWCMLDTLLTQQTISDALTETERRVQGS